MVKSASKKSIKSAKPSCFINCYAGVWYLPIIPRMCTYLRRSMLEDIHRFHSKAGISHLFRNARYFARNTLNFNFNAQKTEYFKIHDLKYQIFRSKSKVFPCSFEVLGFSFEILASYFKNMWQSYSIQLKISLTE